MPNGTKCKGWCPPAVIYLTLALVSTVISLLTSHYHDDINYNGENKSLYTIVHLIGVALWTYVLYWLCYNCHYTTAWVVLLLPIIIGFFIILVITAGIAGGAIAFNNSQRLSRVRRVYY